MPVSAPSFLSSTFLGLLSDEISPLPGKLQVVRENVDRYVVYDAETQENLVVVQDRYLIFLVAGERVVARAGDLLNQYVLGPVFGGRIYLDALSGCLVKCLTLEREGKSYTRWQYLELLPGAELTVTGVTSPRLTRLQRMEIHGKDGMVVYRDQSLPEVYHTAAVQEGSLSVLEYLSRSDWLAQDFPRYFLLRPIAKTAAPDDLTVESLDTTDDEEPAQVAFPSESFQGLLQSLGSQQELYRWLTDTVLQGQLDKAVVRFSDLILLVYRDKGDGIHILVENPSANDQFDVFGWLTSEGNLLLYPSSSNELIWVFLEQAAKQLSEDQLLGVSIGFSWGGCGLVEPWVLKSGDREFPCLSFSPFIASSATLGDKINIIPNDVSRHDQDNHYTFYLFSDGALKYWHNQGVCVADNRVLNYEFLGRNGLIPRLLVVSLLHESFSHRFPYVMRQNPSCGYSILEEAVDSGLLSLEDHGLVQLPSSDDEDTINGAGFVTYDADSQALVINDPLSFEEERAVLSVDNEGVKLNELPSSKADYAYLSGVLKFLRHSTLADCDLKVTQFHNRLCWVEEYREFLRNGADLRDAHNVLIYFIYGLFPDGYLLKFAPDQQPPLLGYMVPFRRFLNGGERAVVLKFYTPNLEEMQVEVLRENQYSTLLPDAVDFSGHLADYLLPETYEQEILQCFLFQEAGSESYEDALIKMGQRDDSRGRQLKVTAEDEVASFLPPLDEWLPTVLWYHIHLVDESPPRYAVIDPDGLMLFVITEETLFIQSLESSAWQFTNASILIHLANALMPPGRFRLENDRSLLHLTYIQQQNLQVEVPDRGMVTYILTTSYIPSYKFELGIPQGDVLYAEPHQIHLRVVHCVDGKVNIFPDGRIQVLLQRYDQGYWSHIQPPELTVEEFEKYVYPSMETDFVPIPEYLNKLAPLRSNKDRKVEPQDNGTYRISHPDYGHLLEFGDGYLRFLCDWKNNFPKDIAPTAVYRALGHEVQVVYAPKLCDSPCSLVLRLAEKVKLDSETYGRYTYIVPKEGTVIRSGPVLSGTPPQYLLGEVVLRDGVINFLPGEELFMTKFISEYNLFSLTLEDYLSHPSLLNDEFPWYTGELDEDSDMDDDGSADSGTFRISSAGSVDNDSSFAYALVKLSVESVDTRGVRREEEEVPHIHQDAKVFGPDNAQTRPLPRRRRGRVQMGDAQQGNDASRADLLVNRTERTIGPGSGWGKDLVKE